MNELALRSKVVSMRAKYFAYIIDSIDVNNEQNNEAIYYLCNWIITGSHSYLKKSFDLLLSIGWKEEYINALLEVVREINADIKKLESYPTRQGYVYLLRHEHIENLYRIGKSTRPHINRQDPDLIVFRARVDGYEILDKALKKEYSDCMYVNGGWYHLTDEQVQEMREFIVGWTKNN